MSNITQGLFKHIPCPNGDACTAVTCLFGHSRERDAAVFPASSSSNSKAEYDSTHSAKRAKTSSLPSNLASYDAAAAVVPPRAQAQARTQAEVQANTQAQTARTGTISPPPLKRKREEPPSEAGPSTTSSNTTAKRPAPMPKRKAETLNPRFVVNAPAKHEIRLRIVQRLHSELVRLNKLLIASKDRPEDRKQFCLSEQGLIWAALDVEEHYAKTKSAAVYSGSIKHRIMDYSRMTLCQRVKELKELREFKLKQAKALRASGALPASASASTASVSSNNNADKKDDKDTAPAAEAKPIDTGLPPEQEFVLLEKYFLTPIDGLANHGYVPKIPSAQDIQNAREADEANQGWEQCDRCQSRFQVFPGRRESDGALASGGQCRHHPGRYNRSTQIYSCCNDSADSTVGCEVGPNHVYKSKDPKRMAALWNFVETPPNPSVPVDQAFCFDCEMAYTVHGMEVVRLTVTSWPDGDRVLDVLIRPKGEIIDLNSRYSGIWPKDFVEAVPFTSIGDMKKKDKGKGVDAKERGALPIVASPEIARSLFHSLIRPETVLIGHALENDLNTMRMVHPRICDTVLLYPHPKGLPIRNGLRVLAQQHMGRTIQAATLAGHDSAEDARAAGDLVRTKIKAKWELMQVQGWHLVGREFKHVN